MDEHLLRYDKDKTIVFIDCETFNLCLNFCHNIPWQIAMIKVKGDKKIDQKNFYLKWDTDLKISEDAARITRYDHRKDQKEGFDPKEVFPTIKDWLGHADYIINAVARGIKYNSIYDPKDDLLEYQYKILNTRKKNVKSSLTFLGKENGIEHDYESLHDAINDLDLNLKVWNKLKWQIEV